MQKINYIYDKVLKIENRFNKETHKNTVDKIFKIQTNS